MKGRAAGAALLLLACRGRDSSPTYDGALTRLVAELEARVPPIALPSLEKEEAGLLAEMIEAYGAGTGRLARGTREEILGHGDRGVAALLAFALDPHRELHGRARAVALLGEIPSDAAAEAAARLAEGADDEALRAHGARALGTIGRRFVVPRLLFRLQYEKSGLAAAYLAGGLARLGNLSGLAGLLVVLDRGETPEAFEVAREIAGPLPEDAAPEQIRAAVDEAHARWIREGAPPGEVPPTDDRLRLGFARWAAQLGDADLRPVADARYILARAGREGIESLRAALRDPNPFARVRAMDVLGWLGPVARSAVPDLLFLRFDPAHRAEPLLALGRIGDPQAAPALLAALEERDPQLRVAAAHGLAELRDPSTAPALRRSLGSPGTLPEVVLYCAQALALLGDFSAVPTLAALADSPVDPSALEQALDLAFGKIREEGLDDAGYADAKGSAEKAAAARRWSPPPGQRAR